VVEPFKTRLLVERLYGVTISNQVHIERYLDGLNGLQRLSDPVISSLMNPVWVDYYHRYADRALTCYDLDYPVMPKMTLRDYVYPQVLAAAHLPAVGRRKTPINP